MKLIKSIRIIFTLPFIIICGVLLVGNAQAELALGDVQVYPGSNSTIDINYTGEINAYSGANLKIIFPEDISVTGVSKGDVLENAIFSLDYKISENSVSVITYSATDLFSSKGTLTSIHFKTNDSLQLEEYSIDFEPTKCAFSNANGSASIAPNTTSGTITGIAGGEVTEFSPQTTADLPRSAMIINGATDTENGIEVSGSIEIKANITTFDKSVDVYYLIVDPNENVFCVNESGELVDTNKLVDYDNAVTPYRMGLQTALTSTIINNTINDAEGVPPGKWLLIWAIVPTTGGDKLTMWVNGYSWGYYFFTAVE